jgi:hypothetical protein
VKLAGYLHVRYLDLGCNIEKLTTSPGPVPQQRDWGPFLLGMRDSVQLHNYVT